MIGHENNFTRALNNPCFHPDLKHGGIGDPRLQRQRIAGDKRTFYGKGIDHLQRQTLSYRKITWANQSSDNVTFHMGKTAQFIGDFNVVADDLYPRIGQAFRQFEAG